MVGAGKFHGLEDAIAGSLKSVVPSLKEVEGKSVHVAPNGKAIVIHVGDVLEREALLEGLNAESNRRDLSNIAKLEIDKHGQPVIVISDKHTGQEGLPPEQIHALLLPAFAEASHALEQMKAEALEHRAAALEEKLGRLVHYSTTENTLTIFARQETANQDIAALQSEGHAALAGAARVPHVSLSIGTETNGECLSFTAEPGHFSALLVAIDKVLDHMRELREVLDPPIIPTMSEIEEVIPAPLPKGHNQQLIVMLEEDEIEILPPEGALFDDELTPPRIVGGDKEEPPTLRPPAGDTRRKR